MHNLDYTKKIYFCHFGTKRFTTQDLRIISECGGYVVENHYQNRNNFVLKIFGLLGSLIKALWYVPQCDIVYSFFVANHCFFPILIGKVCRKKIVVVVAGFDALCIPDLQYGIFFKKGILSYLASVMYRSTDVILPVDISLAKSINYYADPSGKGYPQGFFHYVRHIHAKVIELPFSYDQHEYKCPIDIVKKCEVLSLSSVENMQDFRRKGYDFILQIAAVMPETKFTLAGVEPVVHAAIHHKVPSNVTILGHIHYDRLVETYSAFKVFLQLSLCEGLPNTLCEAMLCQCIPIGSNVNGIPKAIGNAGFILAHKNIEQAKYFIRTALSMDPEFGERARNQIIENFPYHHRTDILKDIIF